MPKITYIDVNGEHCECAVENGLSVMEGAVENSVEGVLAICGGSCACSTCHCYIADEWAEAVGPPNAKEDLVLEGVKDRRPTSRLTCQIEVSDAIDGLVVWVADNRA